MLAPASAPPGQRPPRRIWAAWLLVAYLVPLAGIVLTVRVAGVGASEIIDAIGHRIVLLDLVPGMRFGHVEAAANVALFVPVGFLLAALLIPRSATGVSGPRPGRQAPRPGRQVPRLGWPDLGVWMLAVCASAAIELTQLLLLPGRSGTARDLVCNSLGALVGIIVFRLAQAAWNRGRARNRDGWTREKGRSHA